MSISRIRSMPVTAIAALTSLIISQLAPTVFASPLSDVEKNDRAHYSPASGKAATATAAVVAASGIAAAVARSGSIAAAERNLRNAKADLLRQHEQDAGFRRARVDIEHIDGLPKAIKEAGAGNARMRLTREVLDTTRDELTEAKRRGLSAAKIDALEKTIAANERALETARAQTAQAEATIRRLEASERAARRASSDFKISRMKPSERAAARQAATSDLANAELKLAARRRQMVLIEEASTELAYHRAGSLGKIKSLGKIRVLGAGLSAVFFVVTLKSGYEAYMSWQSAKEKPQPITKEQLDAQIHALHQAERLAMQDSSAGRGGGGAVASGRIGGPAVRTGM